MMQSIVTLTVNPAIDKSVTVKEVVPEKKMKCENTVYEPGGGGINVARAIRKLEGKSKAYYLGGGSNGALIGKLLGEDDVEFEQIPIQSHTRENLSVLETSTNYQYRFGMEGAPIHEAEWQHCLDTIEKVENLEYFVASGSLAPGVPLDFFGRLSAIIKKKNAKLIVDTSGEALRCAANEGVYLLKPNMSELAFLSGKEELLPDEVVTAAKEIISKGNCEVVVVSLGEEGAMMVTENDVYQVKAPVVQRKSTVGAGDSMVAGIVLSIARGKSLEDALRYGVACGTAATMNEGTELCRLEDVEGLYQSLKSKVKSEK